MEIINMVTAESLMQSLSRSFMFQGECSVDYEHNISYKTTLKLSIDLCVVMLLLVHVGCMVIYANFPAKLRT